MAIENILSQEIVQKLGWTLVHFVWQAAAVALLLAVVLRLSRKSSANLRYILACSALALMVLLPVMTIRAVNVSAAGTVVAEPAESAIDVTEGIPIAEMVEIETPPQADNAAAVPRISWRQRAVSVLEPALPYIVAGWLMGVLGLSVWHLGGWTQLQRLRRRMVKPVNASLHSKLKELADLLGINRAVELAESALVGVPTVVGWLKPVILLPASALTGLSGEQLEAILAHELAHIKRGDYLVNILQTVVEILGFYHPAVWWVSSKIRVERENCCDDLAVSVRGDRIRYARALTSMEEIRAGYGLAVAATGGNLFHRICRLVGKDTRGKERAGWIPSAITILLITTLLIPVAFAMSSSQSQKSDAEIKSEEKITLDTSEPAAEEIIQEVLARYMTLQSYSAVGQVVSDMDMSNIDIPELKSERFSEELKNIKEFQDALKDSQKLKHTFSIKLAKPNLYCIQWQQKVHEWFSNTGAVWSSDGKEHFLVSAGQKSSLKSRLFALGAATGVSGGAANTIPSLFFDQIASILHNLRGVSKQQDEEIDDDRCYVLSGQLAGMTMNFWISKKTFLIRQRQQILGSTDGIKMPQFSEDSIKMSLESAGEEITEEKISQRKEMLKSAKYIMVKMKGTITETHRDIVVDQPIAREEFIPDVKADPNKISQLKHIESAFEKMDLEKMESATRLRVEELEKRIESAEKLQELGKALLIYSNDNKNKYPDSLQQIESYLRNEQDLAWLLENVEYLGKGKNIMISPQAVIAYDKTLLEKGEGTNILYNDCHVAFEKPKQLEKLGIKTKAAIQVNTRLLLVPVDANEFNNFFEDESLEAASINTNDDPNLKSYFLDDEQTQQLLKLVNTNPDSNTLAAPKVRVNDGEEATMRIQRKIRYKYTDPNAVSQQPEVKEVPVGTIIAVKPTLEGDGEKILLELDFEQSNFLGFIDGLPQTEIVRIKTRVSVANGSTLLLGGQKMTDQQDDQEVLKTLFCLVKAESSKDK